MKIIDAHIHLNTNSSFGTEDFLALLETKKLEKAVLILNTDEQWEVFERNINRFIEFKDRIHIGLILDTNKAEEFKKRSTYLRDRNIVFSIKLHSRYSKLTVKDFDVIDRYLYTCQVQSIIVDAFYYGSNLENQIGMELSVHLARVFPDKRIIMAHFGGIHILSAMLYTRDLKNIYYDISLTQTYLSSTSVWMDLLHCVKYNCERVMFGSDYPDCRLEEAIEQSNKLIQQLDVNARQKFATNIFYANANKVYFDGKGNE